MAIERILYMYKGDRCGSCGETLNEVIERRGTAKGMFDMNHLDPAKKDPKYTNLIRQKTLSTRQLDEVDKCVLLCKGCHSILHAQDITMEIEVQLEAEGTVIMHKLKCQVIRDLKSGEDQLFTEAKPLLHLVRVKTGAQSEIHSCLQLTENGLFNSLVEQTKSGNEMTIESLDGFCLYRAKKLNETEFEFSHSALFHGIPIRGRGMMEGGELLDIFIRRGQMMLHSHIGRGLGSIRATGKKRYGSSPDDPVEDFQIESPDPEFPHDREINLGPEIVVTVARISK